MAKYAKVRVSTELFELMLKGEFGLGYGEIKTDAPKDLKVIGLSPVSDEFPPRSVFVVCESSEFMEVLEGGEIPVIKPFTYSVERKNNA